MVVHLFSNVSISLTCAKEVNSASDIFSCMFSWDNMNRLIYGGKGRQLCYNQGNESTSEFGWKKIQKMVLKRKYIERMHLFCHVFVNYWDP